MGQEQNFDVVMIGGAFSGASTAILLKRKLPDLRILIVEKGEVFDRKVGESTAEVSACFLTRVLGLGSYLGHHQLPKQGLRVWFSTKSSDAFDDCSEIGPRFQTRMPAYQVDRSHLDQKVLEQALAKGCELWRPAKVRAVEMSEAGGRLEIERRDSEGAVSKTEVTCRWVVDASGPAAVLSRILGHYESLTEHPTNAVWARFRGVRDFEDWEMRRDHPAFHKRCGTIRSWSTNHLVGRGWWCWIIPLKGGDFSIGLVYDTRIFSFSKEGGNLGQRLKAHLLTHPVGREWFQDAEPIEGDVLARSQLPWQSRQTAGRGWFLVGDAAGFMDPLYSPGLDYCSFTATHTAELIAEEFASGWSEERIADYNKRYKNSFRTWFEAVYKDKYYYLGDADLMSAAVLMDVASYFIGPVRGVYRCSHGGFLDLPYSGGGGAFFGRLMRLYNRRLSLIARKRHAAGLYGFRNLNRSEMYGGFAPDGSAVKLLFLGIRKWMGAEWHALWLPKVPKIASETSAPAEGRKVEAF